MSGFNPLGIIGAGIGAIGAIGGMFSRGKANRELKKLQKENVSYKANPLAAERLSLAQSMLNARMPGASYLEQNIFSNQANQMAQVNQNATDSSQALALAAAGQGQTNQALANLGLTEAQDYQRRYGNLVNAQDTQIQEGDKVFADQVRQFQDKVQFAGARAANNAANWQSISNIGQGVMNMGLAGGGWGQMFGKGGGKAAPRIGMPSASAYNVADASINSQFYGGQ
jgi:hypothetical protein